MTISVLIVDDEPHARRYIKSLLQKDTEISILGECKNGREALAFIKKKKPDIILLDIQMPGITGIEVAEKVKDTNSIVIFTTAYDEYALKAFEVEALNYLLKPFDETRFFEVMQKAKDIIEKNQHLQFSEKLMSLYSNFKKSQSPHLTEFEIKENGLSRFININDILLLEARSVYIILHLANDAILYRTTLNELETQLPENFIRIHRSYIINKDFVSNLKYLNNNTFNFTLSNEKEIVSSRSYKKRILAVFEALQ